MDRMRTIHDVLARLRGEYLEMPGLRLTAEQVQRLCGIERMLCQSILDRLVDGAFLSVNPDGTYARLMDGNIVARHARRRQTSDAMGVLSRLRDAAAFERLNRPC
jgi:hypothetical protein